MLLLFNLLGLVSSLDLEESLAVFDLVLFELLLYQLVVHFLCFELSRLPLEFEMQRHGVKFVLAFNLLKFMVKVFGGSLHDDLFDVAHVSLLQDGGLFVAVVHYLLHHLVQIGHLCFSVLCFVESVLHLVFVPFLDVLPLQ